MAEQVSAATRPAESGSYRQILRSSLLVGGASLLVVVIGLVRTKLLALLLGPAGFGLMGLLTSIADVARSLAGLGLNGSGVRQIAAAAASGESDRIERTGAALRLTALVLGVAGAAALALLSEPVARLTFGDARYASAVAVVALGVVARLLADADAARMQGLRRLGDLTRANVWGALGGSAAAVALVVALGERGVAPGLVAIALAALAANAWYGRSSRPASMRLPLRVLREEAGSMLRLGSAFLASGVLVMGVAYGVRLLLVRRVGLDAAGLYQSAATLGGLYVGFLLQAMSADFFPRLVGVGEDDARGNRLVNEQALVSQLLAGPGVLATLALAEPVLRLLYSDAFVGAAEALRWTCVGMAIKTLTWPIGFIVVAKGRPSIFFATELGWAAATVGLTLLAVERYGIDGAGMAFAGGYVCHALVLTPIVRAMSGFRWSSANRRAAAIQWLLLALAFGGFRLLPPTSATLLGLCAAALSGALSLRALGALVARGEAPAPLLRWWRFGGPTRSSSD